MRSLSRLGRARTSCARRWSRPKRQNRIEGQKGRISASTYLRESIRARSKQDPCHGNRLPRFVIINPNTPGHTMDKTKAERLIQAGLDRKADFVELFEEETRNASVSFRDRKVESASAGTDYGLGIRLVYGTEILYAHTSNENEDHIVKLIDNLARSRGIIHPGTSEPTVKLVGKVFENQHKVTKDPREIGQEKKLDLVKLADHIARGYSDKIIQVNAR